MNGVVELSKMVPEKKHLVEAMRTELPRRLWIPMITLSVLWGTALLLFHN